MPDSCNHCTVRGDIHLCKNTQCHTHDSWYAQQQQAEIKRLRLLLTNLIDAFDDDRLFEDDPQEIFVARAALAKEDKP